MLLRIALAILQGNPSAFDEKGARAIVRVAWEEAKLRHSISFALETWITIHWDMRLLWMLKGCRTIRPFCDATRLGTAVKALDGRLEMLELDIIEILKYLIH